jgi:hypothetical protein
MKCTSAIPLSSEFRVGPTAGHGVGEASHSDPAPLPGNPAPAYSNRRARAAEPEQGHVVAPEGTESTRRAPGWRPGGGRTVLGPQAGRWPRPGRGWDCDHDDGGRSAWGSVVTSPPLRTQACGRRALGTSVTCGRRAAAQAAASGRRSESPWHQRPGTVTVPGRQWRPRCQRPGLGVPGQ